MRERLRLILAAVFLAGVVATAALSATDGNAVVPGQERVRMHAVAARLPTCPRACREA
jgi:hypothetical protein